MELRGADYNWDNWAGLTPELLAVQKAASAALVEEEQGAEAAVHRRNALLLGCLPGYCGDPDAKASVESSQQAHGTGQVNTVLCWH